MAEQLQTKRFVTSVLVRDRVGLLRNVTQAVFALDGNIEQIRQTVVSGFFHLIFTSEHPDAVSAETLRDQLAAALDADAAVTVLACEVLPKPEVKEESRYVVMTRGIDKPGTILAITSFLGEHAINIEDWMVARDHDAVVYIAQVTIPETIVLRQLQTAFREAMGKIGLTAILCHENIFRATNEIGPIKSLLK
ncbi:MAG: hypothetical protein J6334_13185 [Kiritimatiellae bacterium]|nr:hypothetical protein [Kiritimatiellia bacterium]